MLNSKPIDKNSSDNNFRYTPVSKRQDRPNAIAWLIRNHPELSDSQVCKLIGTTKETINKIRTRTHWNSTNLVPYNPVTLGFCSESFLEEEIELARTKRPEKILKTPNIDYSNKNRFLKKNNKNNTKQDRPTSKNYIKEAEKLFRS